MTCLLAALIGFAAPVVFGVLLVRAMKRPPEGHHLIKTFWGWHEQQLPDGTGSLGRHTPRLPV
jgi:hypothetical protein